MLEGINTFFLHGCAYWTILCQLPKALYILLVHPNLRLLINISTTPGGKVLIGSNILLTGHLGHLYLL